MKKILICLPSKYYNKYIENNAFQRFAKKLSSFIFIE